MPLPDTAVDHYRQQQRLTLQVLAYAREVWGSVRPRISMRGLTATSIS